METRETKNTIEQTHYKTRSLLGRARMLHTTLKEIKELLEDIYAIANRYDMRERMK